MKRWIFWLGIAISALFLFLALRGLDLPHIWQVVRNADFLWLLPAVLIYFVDVLVRSIRWRMLMQPVSQIPLSFAFPLTAIGYFGNNIFPARAGELLRPVLMKRRYHIPISTSLATVLVERVFDGVVILGFIVLNLSAFSGTSASTSYISSIHSLAFWATIIFLGILIIFILAALFPSQAEKTLLKVIGAVLPMRWRKPAADIIRRFLGGLKLFRSPRWSLLVLAASIVAWLLETLTYWLVMRAFPFSASPNALMLMNGVANLATTIPSAPGYIGTFDAPSIALLTALGVKAELAAGYTLVLHATLWLPITLVGGIFFAIEGLDWSHELDQAKRERQSAQ